MSEVYIEFEGTNREGTVAVGSYVLDVAKRLGVGLECDCDGEEPTQSCAVKVIKGADMLSELTKTEIEQLGSSERKDGQRLACQSKIEKPGELKLMTVKKEEKVKTESAEANPAEGFKKEFEQMPLDEKIASLVELEVIALGETISYVINSPYDAFGKVMDVMAGFGRQKEAQDKDAKVPDEHKGNGKESVNDKKEKASAKETATASDKKPSKPAAKGNGRRKSKKKQEDTE